MISNRTILLVEDDADDREFLQETIREMDPQTDIVFAENGFKAIEYLQGVQKKEEQCPCLIVLDLNLPLLDGKQTYQKIKDDLKLEAIPVIVFTSSRNPNDKALFERLGIEFITKPYTYSGLEEIAGHMLDVCNRGCTRSGC